MKWETGNCGESSPAVYLIWGGVMKSRGLEIFIALAIFCGASPLFSAAGEGGGDCKGVSARIVNFAIANDINRISVLTFSEKGGAEKDEAAYISERISACLAGREKPVLIEQALLEKILKGAGGRRPGRPNDIFPVDAVVAGTVFAAGPKLKVLTRLIDIRTGRVLLADQSESERERAQFPEVPDIELEWDGTAWPLPPSDFRDAVSDPGQGSCAGRKMRLTGLNSELVETKARYWAAKMKEPGFTVRGLSRNPGTEITDPEVKARFYKLLGAYYRSEYEEPPDPARLTAVLDLIAEEAKVYNECGSR